MFKSLNTHALSLAIPFDEALDLARRHGYDGLDLPVGDELIQLARASSIQDIHDRYRAADVRPGGWALQVDFRSSPDTYRAGLEALPGYAAMARALNSPWCFTWILPFSDQREYADNMKWHARMLRPIAEILAAHGCRLGLEFVGPTTLRRGHAHEFIHTMDGALELASAIGAANVGLLLDCWHWYTSHGTAGDLMRLRTGDVVYVHVNDAPPKRSVDAQIDAQRILPGASGVIDIATFLQALQRIDFDGPVAVEPFNTALAALPASECVAAASLVKVWPKDDLSP